MRRLLYPHLALWLVGGAIMRIGLVPAETCPPVTQSQVVTAIDEGANWLTRGLDEDDRFVYGYDRNDDELNLDYNIVRHAGATNMLYQAIAAGDRSLLPAAERSFRYLSDRLFDHDDWTAIRGLGNQSPLGAAGFLVVTLSLRRDISGDTSEDELMRRIGRFILNQQLPDGSMLTAWDQRTEAPVPDTFGPFATGEALWGLTVLHRVFPEEGWLEPALLTAHYLATDRNRNEGYIVRLPDHWAAYSLSELPASALDDTLIDYGRRLASFFAYRIRFESQRTGKGINLWVRWHPGPPAGVGTAGEGMGALYHLALREPRLADVRDDMAEVLTCFAGMMVTRQITAEQAADAPRPGLQRGAWFYRGYSQVDDQQHVLSGLLFSVPAFDDPSFDVGAK